MPSGAVTAGRYGATLYSFPASGTLADRVAVLGNTSGVTSDFGADFDGLLQPSRPEHYSSRPVLIDGSDHSRTLYGPHTVTIPVIIFEDTPQAALLERRRILAAVEARYQRAALEVWDAAEAGQASRWLTEMVYVDASDLGTVIHDKQTWFDFRIQFETIGDPFWTPEPVAGNMVTGQIVPTSPGAVNQLFITNPGDQGAWPLIDVNGLNTNANVSITLGSDPTKQVTIVDVGSGTDGIDFDQRKRPIADGTRVSAASIYFQIPPGDQRLDIIVTEALAINSTVSVSLLPRYSTA